MSPSIFQLAAQLKTKAKAPEPNLSLFDQTASQYPALAETLKGIAFRASPADPHRGLEFYPKGERDSFDPTKPAIEVFGDRVAPKDIAGDLASHYLNTGVDPTVTKTYQEFEKSLTEKQRGILKEQYQWSQKNAGEKRPYEDWYRMSGLPAYFRGYAFEQWPDSKGYYTEDQIKSFDTLNQYLKTKPEKTTETRGDNAGSKRP